VFLLLPQIAREWCNIKSLSDEGGQQTVMGKVAVIDIDNTLWQFCDAFYEELKKINADFPTPDKWTSFDIWEGYCSEAEFFSAIHRIHTQQDSIGYQPYPEARDFLSTLKEKGYYLIIASHRSPDTKNQTERWLVRHGLVYDKLHLSSDKTTLFTCTDVVVDDSPYTLEKAMESGVLGTGLLFPWNRPCADNGFRLFQNLHGVLRYILSVSVPPFRG
jgi:hypothetical protein